MRKIKNAAVTFLIVYMILANSIVNYAAEEGEQGYYLLYMYDQENGASVEIGFSQVISKAAYEDKNMENLILFPIEGGVYHPFQMEQLEEEELTREIREYLLYAGYAQLEDKSIAEDYELEAQEHAELNGLGGWKEAADEQEGEQNSSEIQEAGGEGQTDSNEENNVDAGKVTDAKANDGVGDDDANANAKILNKIGSFIGGWPMPVKIFAIGIVLLSSIVFVKKRRA